jgi:ATP-dependent Clp protease protease subunit
MRTIVEERQKNIVIMDVFSKLIQERIIFIDDEITNELANDVIAQMMYLDHLDAKTPIKVYINSYGGSIPAGLAIYDVSKIITAPINTYCLGTAASMAAILLLMGKERYITKHSRTMLHQPSGGVMGTVEDIGITYKEIEKYKSDLYKIIKENTLILNPEELFRLDTWFNAEESLENGLVTKIL